MKIEQNVILLVTWFGVIQNGCCDPGWGKYLQNKLERTGRFLFYPDGDSTHMFCTVCTRHCSGGYVISSLGCYLCTCAVNSTLHASHADISASSGGVFLFRPCNPAVRFCQLSCPVGYKLGPSGCQYCECAIATSVGTTLPSTTKVRETSSPTTPPTTHIVQVKPQIDGLINQPTIILTTATSSFITHPTTVAPTTHQQIQHSTTTPKPTTVKPTRLTDPCIPTQIFCSRKCDGVYVKGPGGCDYCLCMDKYPASLTTTAAPSSFLHNSSVTTTPTPSPEVCLIAKVICNEKCPTGFISHSDDCLYCACDNSDTAENTGDGTSIFINILDNPCVLSYNECQLQCPDGYLRGPRDCEFCTCK